MKKKELVDEWSNKRVAEKLCEAGVVVMPKKYQYNPEKEAEKK